MEPQANALKQELPDVIVVGSGGAGLAAAATAALHGLAVVVLEKTPVYGGISAISGGGLWIPAHGRSQRPDDLDAGRTYLRSCAGDRFDAERAEAILRNGPAMIDFLERHGAFRASVVPGRPDYHPELPGAGFERLLTPVEFDGRRLGAHAARLRPPARVLTFLGMMIKPGPDLQHFFKVHRSARSAWFVTRRLARYALHLLRHGRGMDLLSGNALIGRLAARLFELGVPIRTGMPVTGLIGENGRVVGVQYLSDQGPGELRCRRGVVLACGGFGHDAARRRAVFPHSPTGAEHWSPAPPGNTGDGLRMAEAAGARFSADLAHPAGWCPVSLVPRRAGGHDVFPHLIDRQKPGIIAVTRHGRRFTNEANSYHDFGAGLIAACAGEPVARAWLIADHRAIRRYGLGHVKPAPVPLWSALRSGYLLRGANLGELAGRAGIDGATLAATVAEFNQHAALGADPLHGRGQNVLNRFLGDAEHAPNPCLAPLVTPPYYAVEIRMGELGTYAGLMTDARGRVRHRDGHAIAGLYAAGTDVHSVMGGDYVASGSTLGVGMTWGYIAACDLAAVVPDALQD